MTVIISRLSWIVTWPRIFLESSIPTTTSSKAESCVWSKNISCALPPCRISSGDLNLLDLEPEKLLGPISSFYPKKLPSNLMTPTLPWPYQSLWGSWSTLKVSLSVYLIIQEVMNKDILFYSKLCFQACLGKKLGKSLLIHVLTPITPFYPKLLKDGLHPCWKASYQGICKSFTTSISFTCRIYKRSGLEIWIRWGVCPSSKKMGRRESIWLTFRLLDRTL